MAGKLLLCVTLALSALGVSGAPTSASNRTEYLGIPISNPGILNAIPNRYIVVYNNTFNDDDIDIHENSVIKTIAKRNIAKRSMTGKLLSTTVDTYKIGKWRAMALDADDMMVNEIFSAREVSYIEQDAYININARAVQGRTTTGLARLSHSDAGARTYVFDDSAGEGITAYVVDTGVRVTHEEFEGRAVFGANFIDNEVCSLPTENILPSQGTRVTHINQDTDTNGHGTHVAGTIGGKTFGVAKKVNIVGVKVLGADGGGSNSGVLAGMQFVVNNATAARLGGKAVMNMSLGGGASPSINAAINNIEAAGVVPVVAAGNEAQDTANTSPGSAEAAITVGAIDQTNDRIAVFSNFGELVDIFAPGVDVLSASNVTDTASETLSGTSMASPHIAGLAAYLMSLEGITGVQAVGDRIKELAQGTGARVRGGPRDTTTLIANNGADAL
jgi:subtilisin family serine protease